MVKRLPAGVPAHYSEPLLQRVLQDARYTGAHPHPRLLSLRAVSWEPGRPLCLLMPLPILAGTSLYDRLHRLDPEETPLTGVERSEIALDVATALAHLHGQPRPVVHKDVKSKLVLLDSEQGAKLADLVTALCVTPQDPERCATCVPGELLTVGYIDPEVLQTYAMTTRADVYAFGVLLMELLTSQKPLELSRVPPSLTLRVAKHVQGGSDGRELADPGAKWDPDAADKVLRLATRCVQQDLLSQGAHHDGRPAMEAVRDELALIAKLSEERARAAAELEEAAEEEGEGGEGGGEAAKAAAAIAPILRSGAAFGSDEWVLEELIYDNSSYLLDRKDNYVYTNPEDSDTWPELLGRFVNNRVERLTPPPEPFTSLAAYQKVSNMNLKDVFAHFDADGSGSLDRDEIQELLEKILPRVTPRQVRYFQVMIDVEQTNSITYLKLVAVVKEMKEVASNVRSLAEEALARIREALLETTPPMRSIFNENDIGSKGALDMVRRGGKE